MDVVISYEGHRRTNKLGTFQIQKNTNLMHNVIIKNKSRE